MTSLTEGGTELERTELNISSLVDTWVLAVTMSGSGERNRGLYVLKSRGMAHSNQIREFLISDEGVKVVPVYVGPEGVLTGSARAAQEAIESDIELGTGDESSDLAAALELRRQALETRLAAMRADFGAEEKLTEREIKTSRKREEIQRLSRLEQARQRTVKPKTDP
jgi:circadian clock protein KaiC